MTPDRAERAAPDWLRGQVVKYCGYRTPPGSPPRLTLPAATVTLVLGWGEPLCTFATRGGPPLRTSRSVVAGLHTSPVLGGYRGSGQAIEVDLTPLGAYACLGIPLAELAGVRVHAEDVLGDDWTRRLTERLAEAPDWDGRWALLDTELGQRMAEGPTPSPVVTEAWDTLLARHGGLTLRQLAQQTGRGGRRLQALFREQIGLPPQTVGRVLRFQRALTLAAGRSYGHPGGLGPGSPGPARSLAALAAESGYYDQAHLSRDFRALAGLTPTRLCDLADDAAATRATVVDGRLTGLFAH
ncbi:helix-turn-helix domain-containing protein [Streptomyces katrae]|uniref:helix-turn-helix domain-containing protein n=1 Tax=Streptomyces katrae TaxID=68223 RepID=UPI0007C55240|nr:helix-turn-helix domain-containing protein [Streptomyces katrae]